MVTSLYLQKHIPQQYLDAVFSMVAWLWLMKSLLCSFRPFHFRGGRSDSGWFV